MRRALLHLSLGSLSVIAGACGGEPGEDCDCAEIGCAAEGCTKTVFVTPEAHPANFGGLAQADALCQDAATRAGLEGTYYAWLSTSTSSPNDRFSKTEAPHVLADGTSLAAGWDALLASGPAAPIDVDASGAKVPDETQSLRVWTNTGRDGRADDYSRASDYCSDWTRNTAENFAVIGWLTRRNQADDWTYADASPCTGPAHLYCFQQ